MDDSWLLLLALATFTLLPLLGCSLLRSSCASRRVLHEGVRNILGAQPSLSCGRVEEEELVEELLLEGRQGYLEHAEADRLIGKEFPFFSRSQHGLLGNKIKKTHLKLLKL